MTRMCRAYKSSVIFIYYGNSTLYVAFPAKLRTFNEKQLLENKPFLFFFFKCIRNCILCWSHVIINEFWCWKGYVPSESTIVAGKLLKKKSGPVLKRHTVESRYDLQGNRKIKCIIRKSYHWTYYRMKSYYRENKINFVITKYVLRRIVSSRFHCISLIFIIYEFWCWKGYLQLHSEVTIVAGNLVKKKSGPLLKKK